MKNVKVFFSLCVLFAACKKEINNYDNLNSKSADQLVAHLPNDAVLAPMIDSSKTTSTQYASNGYYDVLIPKFTLNFAAKKSGIKIISLTFVAYSSNTNDARVISIADSVFKVASFSPSANFPKAVASAKITGLSIKIHSGGILTPITFNIGYNKPSSATSSQAADTISVRLASVQYTDLQRPDTVTESIYSPRSPVMMITTGRPEIFISPSDPTRIQTGLTKLLAVAIGASDRLTINNLPLQLAFSNVTINNQLVLKDYSGNTINTATKVSGKNYTIQIQPGLLIQDIDGYSFNVYANVQNVQSNAVIKTNFQPSSNFSWIDNYSYNKKNFTVENTKYLLNYPTATITVHN